MTAYGADMVELAESKFLDAAVADPTLLDNGWLYADDFASEARRLVFRTIGEMSAEGLAVDRLEVADRLKAQGHRQAAAAAIRTFDTPCAPENAEGYAQAIRAAAQKRRLLAVAEEIQTSELPPAELVDSLLARLQGVAVSDTREFDLASAGVAAFHSLDAKPQFVPSGYADLDAKIGGFHPGDLVVVGARPAMGKTAFALNLIARADYPCGLISGEQDASQIGMRQLAIIGLVSAAHAQSPTA